MQSVIFQAFICYHFDDYGLQLIQGIYRNPEANFNTFLRLFQDHPNIY